MKITMSVELVENGLIIRKREGNRWGEKRYVIAFRNPKSHVFDLMDGESVQVGEIVRQLLFKQAEPASKNVAS